MIPTWLRNLSAYFGTRSTRRPARPLHNIRRATPRIAMLETRIVPTVTSTLVGSVATVTSDAAADAINITQAAGFLLLNGSFDWDTAGPGIQFLAAANTSTINLDTGAGADTVNFGDTGASPASLNLARVNYNSGGAGDELHVFDNGNGSANTYTYNTSTFVATGIDLNVGGTAITGGRFLVTGTAADTVLVQSVFGGEACTIDSTAGNDSATIGTAGVGMGSINAQVTIENNTVADFTVVTLQDSADTTADVVNITRAGNLVTIAGLADGGGSIVYDDVDVQVVTINAGSGGNTFNVAPINESLNLNAGTGNDTLTLVATGTTGTLESDGIGTGTWDWTGFGAIKYSQLDFLQTDGSVNVPLTMTGTATGDFLRLSRPGAGTNLRVSEGGVTWILVPFVQVDNTITVNGGLGNDRLEVDQGTDLTIHRTINYNGEGGTDSLLMNGNLTGASSGTYNPGAADPDGFSGQVVLTDSVALICTVNFTGLSPVEDLTVVANYTINGFAGADTINIVDGPLSSGADPITGNQESTIEVNFNGAAELIQIRNKPTVIVDAKAGVDTITLSQTVTGTGLTNLTIDSNDGDDQITVLATASTNTTAITSSVSSGGLVLTDTVIIGNASGNGVQSILGVVSVQNPSGLTNLTITDVGDTAVRSALITPSSISGLAPAAINYAQTGLNSLTVNGDALGNTFTVAFTPENAVVPVVTTLNSGTGADVVNVLATSGLSGASLEIQGQSGLDTVNIGSAAPALGGGLASISGAVTIRNTSSFSAVTMDDSGDAVARSATLDTVLIGAQSFGRLTGLGNVAPIQYAIANSGDVSAVTIHGGSGGNSFLINQSGSAAAFTTTINTGTGNDSVTIQVASANVTYVVDGQIGVDTLTGPDLTNTWNITGINAGNITGIASFTNVENLTGGSLDDSFIFATGGAVGGQINGGTGTDLLDYSALTTAIHANLGISITAAASFDGYQEVGPTASAATGTSNITYNAATGKFDITASISGVSGTILQGFNLEVAPAGTNGPVIIDMLTVPGAAFALAVGAFTYSATGVDLPGVNEAEFLGDNTYLNLLTNSFPTGEVRGQVIRQTQSASATGLATGAGSITGIENATGGSADDSLVGSSVVNVLSGNKGKDTILGGQGGDTMNGGDDGDVIIWANGDGSDIIEGGNGSDTVQVNGAPAGGDAFLVSPNGTRLTFQRTNLGLFTLDIGTTETLAVNGNASDDTFTVNNLAGVSDLTAVNLFGNTGSDSFSVAPSPNVTVNVDGDQPAPPTLPGDVLNIVLTGTTNPTLTSSTTTFGTQGGYTFGNRLAVNFRELETLGTPGPDLGVTVTDGKLSAVPGTKNSYTIVVSNAGALDANGATIKSTIPAELTGATYTAVAGGGATGFTAAGNGAISDSLNLPIGGSVTYTVTGTIASNATGTLDVTAKVQAPAGNTDPNPGNNAATDSDTLTPQADLAITIADLPDPVAAGAFLTYTIVVTTNGPSDAQTVLVSIDVPVNTTFVSWQNPTGGWTLTPPPGNVGTAKASLATLTAQSGAQIFTFIVEVNGNTPSNTVIAATAKVSSTTADIVPGNNTANETTLVRANNPIVVGADAGSLPRVEVYSSFSGSLLASFNAYDTSFTGGVRVTTGDVTGDGIPDIITAAGPSGGPHVKVFDGVTFAEIQSFFAYNAAFTGGVFVGSGDVNGDGLFDIITGADAGGGPHVQVFSGGNGSVLASFFAYDAGFTGGVRVAGGDVDGDGKADIVTGAGPGGGPHVEVFSGASGALLRSFYAYDAAFKGGVYVAAGDMNNDGKADIVTGAGAGGGPHVQVFDGTTLGVLASFMAYDIAFNGGVRVASIDADTDGQFDIVTGAGPGGGPHVQAFNGSTLATTRSFFAFDPSFTGGVFVG